MATASSGLAVMPWTLHANLQGPPGEPGPAGEPAQPGAAGLRRQSISHAITTALPPGAPPLDFSISAGPSGPVGPVFQLLAVMASGPCWLRIYRSATSRAADPRTAPGTSPTAAGAGLVAEFVFSAAGDWIHLAPVAVAVSDTGEAFCRVVSTASSSQSLTLIFDVLSLVLA